ncbi:kinesin 3 [Monocercomonoides exilis]|uniref:kinesin 3 n=1 Tax=Monocercomonoides exilis TaxID=2049356 RepID=UPI00355A0EA0|nr:kinesin 3 [Monocercomonoides exilis]|eukprot:MONOS_9217.1-p1 / transcript=MONOS_9217.1 / gene=MONOS_9217 / organism=Monocercomonoides_exilis_PA203 / gene_product=kinesin 3 / transcript_product=kinesin 3 / location=Mono_scaffold00372:22624-26895(+) / protein_length=1117 / sequence_SO=supercontig / SO=protein_coding / is_pseudo=false
MSEAVTVAVRVRPLNSKEKKEKCTEIQKISGKTITITNPEKKESKTFTFDYVYGTKTTQDQVFNDLGKLYLENCWNGFNCTLFAYGQTGAGKSYSMTGSNDSPDSRGIIPRGCEEMFRRIEANDNPDVSYDVRVSYLELYNEKLQDLLDPKSNKEIKIRESPTKGVYVENVVEEPVASYKEIEEVIDEGEKARTVAATNMNATSSRSHSVLTIYFTRHELVNEKKTQRDARVNLVDLAGSERQSKTGATGQRLAEANAINKSLSALGNVITALSDQAKGKKVFVPYRDSTLTRMLQDSLGGNSKTIMIAAMSPASSNYDEGVSTLQYADRAKQIKNKPVVNESESDKLIKELKAQLEELQKQLASGGAGASGGASTAQQEADLDAERERLEAEKIATAKREAELAEEKAKMDAELAALRKESAKAGQPETDAEKALKKKLDQLESERKELEMKVEQESEAEQALEEKEAQLQEMKEEAEAAENELKIAQMRLSEMTETAEEKRKKVEEIRKKRKSYLDDMGLSRKEIMELAAGDSGAQGPQLKNLSLCADLSGNLVYFLKEGEVVLGSDQKQSQIVSKGMGIAPAHAVFVVNAQEKRVVLRPLGDERVLVNGKWVGAAPEGGEEIPNEVELNVGDRLIVGRSVMFRFLYDAKGQMPAVDASEQAELLQAELAVASGKCDSVDEYRRKMESGAELFQADSIIDEANAIAAQLHRKINYAMDIQMDANEKNRIAVIVNNHEENAWSHTQEWDISVLEERLPLMREILADYAEDGVIDNPPENDPFYNPPDDEPLGTAVVSLRNLILAGAMRVTLGVRDEMGKGEHKGEAKFAFTLKMKAEPAKNTASKTAGKTANKAGNNTASSSASASASSSATPSSSSEPSKEDAAEVAEVPAKEVTLPLKTAPANTYAYSEAAQGKQDAKGSKGVKMVKTKLKKIVDTDKTIGNTVVMAMEVKSVQMDDDVEEVDGLFVRFSFPPGNEQISERSNCAGKVLKTWGASASASSKSSTKPCAFRFEFPSFSAQDVAFFMESQILVEVWGHAPFTAAASVLGELSPLEKAVASAKKQLASVSAEEAKTKGALSAKEMEITKMKKEMEELKEKYEKLEKEKNESSSCQIL